jgi:hypothetical protein
MPAPGIGTPGGTLLRRYKNLQLFLFNNYPDATAPLIIENDSYLL